MQPGGLPWEDLGRINPANNRNPTDPIWTPLSIWGEADGRNTGGYWTGRQAVVCADHDTSGLRPFFNTDRGYTIPYGTTRSGWVCLTFSDSENTRPMPSEIIITSRPERARLTRWTDVHYQLRDSPTTDAAFTVPVADSAAALCEHAAAVQPDGLAPNGFCGATP